MNTPPSLWEEAGSLPINDSHYSIEIRRDNDVGEIPVHV